MKDIAKRLEQNSLLFHKDLNPSNESIIERILNFAMFKFNAKSRNYRF